ncbi:FAM3D isoform 5 [Pan troglodytes]|uniref:FAM3 metabolism regulating signaling molecule D n=2 Tax=Homininae TaxID=207598 RepID=F8WCI4_HUMAN|nr:FAM3D isoform 5 [Pan troglodytes]
MRVSAPSPQPPSCRRVRSAFPLTRFCLLSSSLAHQGDPG